MLQRVHTSEDLGRAIRQARRAKNLTLAEVALAAGAGVRFVSELERGKATAEVGRALQVMAVIGMRVFVDGDGIDADA
jgi:transcriptional regulator with XRE-family HTH domain